MAFFQKPTFKKLSLILMSTVLLTGVLSACGSNSKNETSQSPDASAPAGGASASSAAGDKPYDGIEINVGVEAGGPAPEFYKSIISEFTDKTGIKVNIMDVPGQNMHDRYVTESIAHTGGFDVFNMDQPWIPEFAEKGFIEPITAKVDKVDLEDFFPSAIDTVSYKGEIYALPYLVQTPIVYYRKDLFEKAGITAPAKTPEEWRTYAKQLTDPANDIFGTIIEGQQSPEPATQFTDMILQHGGKLIDENNKVLIDSPEVLNAFKYALAIQHEDKSSPPGAVGYNNGDVGNMFLQGKVAMVRNWPYMYSMAKDPAQSKVADKFAIAVQPGTSAVWSWSFGISSDSKNKDAAYEFVKWASSSEVIARFATKVLNPIPRKSTLELIKASTTLAPEDINAITIMANSIDQGQSVTLNPSYDSFRNRLSVSLSKIMTQQATPEEELKAAVEEFQKIADGK
jgi:multiple sugar transport system substrate-binding protein